MRTSDSVREHSSINFTIRDARPGDAHILAQAEREIAKTPGFLVSYPRELIDERFCSKIRELTGSNNGKYLVAERDNEIIAHAMLDPLSLIAIRHVVHLTLAVHSGWQGKDVGKALLAELIVWAKSAPLVEKIELHTRSSNLAAIALYLKQGFTEEGRWKRRVKIGEGEYLDDVLMGLWVKEATDGQ